MKYVLFVIFFSISITSFAQIKNQKFGIKLSGFVNTETFWDSRQAIASREGDVLLFPTNEKLSIDNKDINSKANFNILAMFSRIKSDITAPDVLGAKTSGVIEFDFAGNSNLRINTPRVRHAYIKLDWEKFEILTGQYWHPIFPIECYPEVLNWGGGLPMAPLSRTPQVRFTYKPNPKLKLDLVALSERDFISNGPSGASSMYLRNSAIPEFQLSIIGSILSKIQYGIVVGYKTLVPRLENNLGFVVNEKISSYNSSLFLKYKHKDLSIAIHGVYGQDHNSVVMLGGYAVSKSKSDLVNDNRKYTHLPVSSIWTEIIYNIKPFAISVFAGYTKNIGATEEVITNMVYARGTDMDYVYQIAPRITYRVNNFRFGTEFIQATAAYGTPNTKMQVKNTKEITNYRILFSSYLYF